MPSVVILDREKAVDFVDADPDNPLDRPALMAGLEAVAARINGTLWTDEQRDAFDAMEKIVFFQGSVQVGPHILERPGCDEANATFYWEAVEFLANPDPGVRANTLFHDCWHVVQYRAGGYARGDDERVWREVDAINHQIVAAEALGCRPADIDYLRRFEGDQAMILARLKEGVDTMHHA